MKGQVITMNQNENITQQPAEKGNKHVKVEVRYVGKPKLFKENCMPTDLVEIVKRGSMKFFEIEADPHKYYLQYGEAKLNDALTLEAAGIDPDNERVEFILSIMDNNDVDGGNRHA